MPAIQPPQSNELTDADLDRLDELLHAEDSPHAAISLEVLDGFFSALVIGPGDVPAEEYMPYIEGDTPMQGELLELVQRLWNQIVRRVKLDPQAAEEAAFPLLAFPDDVPDEDSPELDAYDYPVGADWAAGFLLGASLRGDEWDERMEMSEDLAKDFEDIESLLVENDDEFEADDFESEKPAPKLDGKTGATPEPLGFRARMAILGEIPYLLHDMHLWRLQEQAPAQRPVRRDEKPDRNGPCPCGSGKKFKKCCGDPARLH